MTQSLIKSTAIERIPGPNRVVVTNNSGDLELPMNAELTVYERANLPASTFTVTDPRLYPYLLNPATLDGHAVLQQCVNAVSAQGGGTVLLPFLVPITKELDVPENVDLVGLDKTCGLLVVIPANPVRIPSAAVVARSLTTPSPVSRKQTFKGFTINAQYHGARDATGQLSGSSMYNFAWSGVGEVPLGSLIEGVGVSRYTTVIGVSGNTLTLSSEVEGTNGADRAVVRPSLRMTVSSVASSTNISMVSTTGLVPGMRVTGAQLRDSDDDHPDVMIVSVAETSIEVSRPANSSASFEMIAWVEVDGIRVTTPPQANTSPSSVVLTDVTLLGISGTAVISDGRACDASISVPQKAMRDGIRSSNTSSLVVDDSFVAAWDTPLRVTNISEVQSSRLKTSGTALIDQTASVVLTNVHRAIFSSPTLPSSIWCMSNSRSAVHLIDPVFMWGDDNFFSTSSLMYHQAYIHARNTHVHLSNPVFVVTGSMAPSYVLNVVEGSTLSIVGGPLATNGDGAYSVGLSTDAATAARLTVDRDGGFMTMGHGSWQPEVFTDIPGNLSLEYGSRRGDYTILPGGTAYVSFDVTFIPFYTTAQGALIVGGLGGAISLDPYFNRNPISVAIATPSQWASGATQLYGEVDGSGNIRIMQTGSMIGGTTADFDLLTNSGEPLRVVGWGTVRMRTNAAAPTNLWVDANTWDDSVGWVD